MISIAREQLQQVWLHVPLIAVISVCLYRLLPLLACRLNRRLSPIALKAHQDDRIKHKRQTWKLPGLTWLAKSRSRLLQAGYDRPRHWPVYLALQVGLPSLLLLSGLPGGRASLRPMALALLAGSAVNGYLQHRITSRQKAFVGGLYKMYRFLNAQVSAGLAVTDALKGLHEAVRDPVVRPVLVRFAALYEMTLDFSLSFEVIEQYFGGKDSTLLAGQITQCLQTGIAGKSLTRLEDLYFTRAFTLMQEETRRIKAQLTGVVAGGLVPVVIVFLFPLLQGALSALQTIFN